MEDRDKIIDYTKPIRLPDDCSKVRKNFTQGYFYREIGRYNNLIPSEFQWAAEDKLINKNTFEELKCQLPDSPRSTFLMVFSPDGKKVASTHGNHNVYVTDLTTGKNIQTLSGHPRTPWCIAFHPSSNQILASGCLGGQVRVWDLHGGSEVWTTESQTVIASLAFHPVDRMLVIATYNELHFWDWSQPEPFAKCSTKSEKEKVRYVSFDRLGNKLITGIANLMNVPSQWDRINIVNSQSPSTTTTVTTSFSSTPTTTVASTQSSTDQGRSITFCYRHLMNQYNQLVNRYFDLSRSRITPTIDRGTDPMDLLDIRNNGSSTENSTTNPSPSTSNSQLQNSASPLRFKITRSGSRTYRCLSGRERFRLHSSVFSRLNSRSSRSPNSYTFSTTSSMPSNQHSTFTAPSSQDSPSTSSTSSQSTPRLRRCAFSLGSTARSWCLTFTPENTTNPFTTRNVSQSGTGAVTNPTYTSYSDRGIFSTRESSSNSSGSQFSVVCPYRVLLDDLDDHQLTIHRATQPESVDTSSNRPASAGRSITPTSRSDFNTASGSVSAEGSERDSPRTSEFRYRRHRYNTNLARNSALRGEPSSNYQPTNPTRSASSFQLSTDARVAGSERRPRESDSFDRRYSRYSGRNQSESLPLAQSLMHPRPVPRFQVRSRLPQDQQSQLQLITNRETHGLNLQNNQSLRRQLSFRPGGQFVLSRHSNSPFQPRIPHQVYSSSQIDSPVTSKSNPTALPDIPTHRSAASSNLNSAESGASSSTSSDSNTFSPSSVASNLSFSGESSSRQLREQIKTRLFDRVKMMLRDRMRNSDIPSVDSTVNYSQISGEPEEVSPSTGLGPRGADPMLSSASDHREGSNDGLLFRETSSTLSGSSTNAGGSGINSSQNDSEILDLWESESETPFSLGTNLPLSDLLSEVPSQTNREETFETNESGQDPETDPGQNSSSLDNASSSATEQSMRQGIQRLSLHIENMQKLCLARIELLQRQKIRGIWENLTNQIRHFQSTIQTPSEEESRIQNDNSNSSTDLPSLRDLAISSSPVPEASSSTAATSSNYNSVINSYKELLESMVNELFNEAKKSKKSAKHEQSSPSAPSTSQAKPEEGSGEADPTPSTSDLPSKNETEEPQPGPSGLSAANTPRAVRHSQLKNENFKFRLYKLFIEALQKERRRRDARPVGLNAYCGNFRLRNSSRGRLRNSRHGRHILDFFSTRSRSINRELESILKLRKKERNANKANQSTSSTSGMAQPSTSTDNESCLSCGQKKKPTREFGRQKRRNVDTSGFTSASSSASKLLKSNTGEPSRVPSEESRADGATPSTSSAASESTSSDNSTNELLKQMFQTMETMLQFLRDAFSRTEELTGNQFVRQPQQQHPVALPSSGDDTDDSDSNDLAEESERFLRNLPRHSRSAKEIISNLMRDVTQLRAKKLLSFTVKCLTQIFGKNFGNLIQVLDEQIFSLSMLLHLALQLTDLLLDHLNARSRDLERNWDVDNVNFGSVESRKRNLLLSRSASDRRDRIRNLGRNSHNQPFGSSRDDSRSRVSSNPFFPSNSRLGQTRLGTSDAPSCSYDRSGTFLSNYVRRKRRTARMSTSLPSGWASRRVGSRIPTQSSMNNPLSMSRDGSSNGNPTADLRNFRFGRRANEDHEAYSGIPAFGYEGTTDNNYNNNSSDNVNDSNNNNNMNNYSNSSDGYYNNNNFSNANQSSGVDSSVTNSGNNTNHFFNHYFPTSSNSNTDTSNNNIIIVTGLNSDTDVLNNLGSNASNSSDTGGEGNTSRPGGSNSTFVSQNPLTPLRSMELTLSRNEGDLSLRDERPIFWIRYGGNSESTGSSNNEVQSNRVSTFTVPVVQVNDVPVSDVSMLNQPRHRPQSPVPRGPEDILRWRAWRPRLLHPRYSGPNPFEDQDSSDIPENIHYYRILSTSAGSHLGVYTLDPMIITDAPMAPRHRIQAWDFSKMNIPDISDREANGVVPECKIHNDASVDVSNDGHLLVTLLPSGRLSVTTMLGVYSLDWSSLGQLLYRTSFEQNAVSVSLSPTNRHLLVGLASRPVVVRDRTNMAQIFRLEGGRPSPNGGSWQSGRGRLVHMRDLEQTRETNIMSLNCIRWAPGAGQGLVYGTNTGQLKVLR